MMFYIRALRASRKTDGRCTHLSSKLFEETKIAVFPAFKSYASRQCGFERIDHLLFELSFDLCGGKLTDFQTGQF